MSSDFPSDNPTRSYYWAHLTDQGTGAQKVTWQSPRAGWYLEMIFEQVWLESPLHNCPCHLKSSSQKTHLPTRNQLKQREQQKGCRSLWQAPACTWDGEWDTCDTPPFVLRNVPESKRGLWRPLSSLPPLHSRSGPSAVTVPVFTEFLRRASTAQNAFSLFNPDRTTRRRYH